MHTQTQIPESRRRILRAAAACFGDRGGSIAILAALGLPMLLVLVGGALDFAKIVHQRFVLQAATDAAALSTAKQLSLSDSSSSDYAAIGAAVVKNYVLQNVGAAAASGTLSVQMNVTNDPLEVRVESAMAVETYFQGGFGMLPGTIEARATARVVGNPNICLLALAGKEDGAISLEHQARVTGRDCAVFSNSTHTVGITTKNSAVLKASTICSAGGVQGGGSHFDPPPHFDCPQFEDPLADRPEPMAGICMAGGALVVTGDKTLLPGTYCGLTIENGAEVTFEPGIYVIRDNPLIVRGGAQITGEGVGFFVTGPGAQIEIAADSAVGLEAPKAGPLAGLLFFASREGAKGATHTILSENAQNLVGTIYLPTGELRVDGAAQIGEEAAYTAIVAEKVRLYGGPHIVLNSNYEQTDVPVPAGIKGAGQPIALVN